jgi:hypothetical protein
VVQRGLPAAGQRADLRFRGYTLDAKGRPTFAWSSDGMRIAEKIDPMIEGGKAIVRRTIRLTGRPATGEAWFRAAVAGKVEESEGEWLRIDGTWRVRVRGAGVGPAVRHAVDGKTEVRHAIVWGAGDGAEFVEELSW